MKIQLSVIAGLLLISTVSFAQSPKCSRQITKAAQKVESAEVLNQLNETNRSVEQSAPVAHSTIEQVTTSERQEYVQSKCGSRQRFKEELHAHLARQTPESFPLASRVACDEIIVSAAENRVENEGPKKSTYFSNQRDFVNFGCGTAKEYVNLVSIQMSRPQATSENEDVYADQGDRESRQQMIQAAREEFNARRTQAPGAK